MRQKRETGKKVPELAELFSDSRIILPTNKGRTSLKQDLGSVSASTAQQAAGAIGVDSRFQRKSCPVFTDNRREVTI
ncbi:hypothetical protein [Rhizobium sp. BE258]|uniref:hypothetical protein n=1 Tax=Rhizobium sp. BE258 TaxID=2817722 RepID=UPI0028658829|nr:hypothetical protein [Rhizobium sp. BE258]MDR7144086.1 hypothetical protein [Rhizobium sp. BE258]